MRELTYDGRRLCELQARVFEASIEHSGDSSAVFVRRFMRSELARRLDVSGSAFEFTDVAGVVREVDSEFGGKAYGSEKYAAEEMHWMGYIYRYWCCSTGESSKMAYSAIGARELRSLFFAYHSLDPAQAVERIREAKGIAEDDEVRRGVEFLRRIRF